MALGRYNSAAVTIDLTQDEDGVYEAPTFYIEEEDDIELVENDDFVRELTPNEIDDLEARFAKLDTSPSVPPEYERVVAEELPSGDYIHEGINVELEDGDFMRIMLVLRHLSTQSVWVKGTLLRRTRRVNNFFKKDQNELCAIMQDAEGARPNTPVGLDSTLVLRPLEYVIRLREILFTNAKALRYSYRESASWLGKNTSQIQTEERLVCRRKFIEYVTLRDRRVVSGAVIHLSEAEADSGNRVSDVLKKQDWTGHVEPTETPEGYPDVKPTLSKKRKNDNTIDLTGDDDTYEQHRGTLTPVKRVKPDRTSTTSPHSRKSSGSARKTVYSHATDPQGPRPSKLPRGTYRYGDICAGAGGMTRGAHAAGLTISWLLDHWEPACETLELNWPGKSVCMSINDFCNEPDPRGSYRVDVLHISFPCQPYAACHTIAGKNDDANSSAGYSVLGILSKARPRVVTFEQTATFLTRHPDAFSALIHQLTVMEYNVRWKIFVCSEFGNVQPRKRLFLIASCPGEPLPPFPNPTYGSGPGRKPFTTIADRFALLPRNISEHMRQFTPKEGRYPYNPNTILRGAITCDGGKSDLHPDGDRSNNMQELALLAGFPPHHRFVNTGKTNLRRLIGNAVPSMVAEQIFKEVVKSMKEADRVVENYKPEVIELGED